MNAWVPPKPVLFAFDPKKPKPDAFAAYTITQIHDAYRAGQASLNFPRVPENEAITGQTSGVADGTRTYAGTQEHTGKNYNRL